MGLLHLDNAKRQAAATFVKGDIQDGKTTVIPQELINGRCVPDMPQHATLARSKLTDKSVIDGILRATNLLLAGTNFVICGFGWCGKGVAARAKGMGANVIVIEVDSLRALEAVMEGYCVLPMEDAAALGDIFVTSTGNRDVIRQEHFEVMKDGAILANAGHFDVEIDLASLRNMAASKRKVRDYIEQYVLKNGRCLNLLTDGRLVNLGAAEGHPASVMDLSFANQALSVEFIAKRHRELEKQVYIVPEEIDKEIARLKLNAMGIHIDNLTGNIRIQECRIGNPVYRGSHFC